MNKKQFENQVFAILHNKHDEQSNSKRGAARAVVIGEIIEDLKTRSKLDHICAEHTVYKAGGYFSCSECGEEYYFLNIGLKAKDLEQYYEFWDNPEDPNYQSDKEAMEFFRKEEADN